MSSEKTQKKIPTVMLIDDQPDWLMINKRALVKAGYPCETFLKEKEALKAFKENPDAYKIIVLDINLGAQADGVTVAGKIFNEARLKHQLQQKQAQ